MAAIGASEKNLDRVFCREYVFRIPVYQRPYAWELEHVEVLLDDLLDAMDRDKDEPYFLGSIVLIKTPDEPESDVVDGQQRLTTLTMLFCVLRESTDGEWPDSIDERIRQRRDVATGRPEVVRLRHRARDQKFFHQYIQAREGIGNLIEIQPPTNTDSQTRIVENVRYLDEKIRKLTPERRVKLAEFMIQRCFLVVVTTSSKSSAYRIFAVMNDRGLDLSPTDILKADITGEIADERSRTTYAEKWESVEEALGRDRFSDLFSHIRMVYAKEKSRRNLQDEFRDHVLAGVDSEAFIDDVLLPYSEAYEKAVGLDDDVPTQVKLYLKHLSRLDNVDWIPPAMALFFNLHFELGQRIEYVRGLERLAYGLFILRANVNKRIARFSAVVNAFQEGNHHEILGALELKEDERTSINSVLDGPIYSLARVPKPLLLRLDGLLAGAEATYDHPIVTIEHVLPQTPRADSQWIEWFPNDLEREQWTHRLANLVLLSRRKNTRASNFEFERKKREYFQREFSPFPLTMSVLQEEEWTPSVLEKRQEELLGKLTNEWCLN